MVVNNIFEKYSCRRWNELFVKHYIQDKRRQLFYHSAMNVRLSVIEAAHMNEKFFRALSIFRMAYANSNDSVFHLSDTHSERSIFQW